MRSGCTTSPAIGMPVGRGMDGVNRRAVGPPDCEALDLRLMTPVSECSHGREP